MPYTTDDDGRLNNFAIEPKVYEAQPPTPGQKRLYLFLGIGGVVLVLGLIGVAAAVS